MKNQPPEFLKLILIFEILFTSISSAVLPGGIWLHISSWVPFFPAHLKPKVAEVSAIILPCPCPTTPSATILHLGMGTLWIKYLEKTYPPL